MNKLIQKIEPVELQEDLKQELFIVICELDEDVLIGMFNDNVLKYYCVRIILNMGKSYTSSFYIKYRKQESLLSYQDFDGKEFDERLMQIQNQKDNTYKIAKEARNILSNLEKTGIRDDYYYSNLFNAYVECGCSSKKLSEQTKIPERTIRLAVANTRKYLKAHLQKFLL